MSERKDLYEVLGVARSASAAEIKKAYHRLALQLHPDKNPGDSKAAAKFQALQRIYGVLGDADKRKIYDETGSVEDSELRSEAFDDLCDYYRRMFAEVSADRIDDYMCKYRGSEEETADLLEQYTQHAGNMDRVFEWVICSEPALDSHRFMDAVEAAIKDGKVKRYKAFTAWAKTIASKSRPANPLQRKSSKGKKGANDSQALVAAINAKRGATLDAMVSHLASKYGGAAASLEGPSGGKGKGKRAAAAEAEPTEEEFEAARARLAGGIWKGGSPKKGPAAAGSSGKKQRR